MSFSVSHRTSRRLPALSGPITVTRSLVGCRFATARLPFAERAVRLFDFIVVHPSFDFSIDIQKDHPSFRRRPIFSGAALAVVGTLFHSVRGLSAVLDVVRHAHFAVG